MLLGNKLKAVLLLFQGGDNKRKNPSPVHDQTVMHLKYLVAVSHLQQIINVYGMY